MGRLRVALCLMAVLFLSSCAEPLVVVLLASTLPEQAVSLELFVSFGDQSSVEHPEVTLPPAPRTPSYSLFFRLPPDAEGTLSVAVAARDGQGCLIATSVTQQPLSRQARQQVDVALRALGPDDRDRSCDRSVPQVLSVDPKAATNGGQDFFGQPARLAVTGWGFAPGAQLFVGAVPATGVRWESPLRLTVDVPAQPGVLGKVPLSVVNPAGPRGTLAGFRYAAQRVGFENVDSGVDIRYQLVGKVLSGDMNEDGQLDLISEVFSLASSYYAIGVRLNRGGGEFEPTPAIYGTSSTQLQLLNVTDITGDGQPDFYINDNNTLLYVRNRGPTNTLLQRDAQSSPISFAGAVIDCNGDGAVDALEEGSSNINQKSRVVLQLRYSLRNGAFSVGVPIGYGRLAGVGDVNGDSWPDVVWSETPVGVPIAPPFYLALNVQGAFQESVLISGLVDEQLVGMVDWRGDGRSALVLSSPRGSQISVVRYLEGGATEITRHPVSEVVPEMAFCKGSFDVNRDGLPDLLGTAPSGDFVSFNGGQPGAELARIARSVYGLPAGCDLSGVDLDQDGGQDVLLDSTGWPNLLLNRSR